MSRVVRTLCVLVFVPALVSAGPLEDGKLLLTKLQYKAAIGTLEEAAKTDTTGEALYCLATAQELSGDGTTALATYRRVVDGKGVRAAEAERHVKKLEARATDAATIQNARTELVTGGLESSERLKAARQRVELATEKLEERKRQAKNAKSKRYAKAFELATAETLRDAAAQVAADWQSAGLSSPGGRGRGLRMLGGVITAAGGLALGASLWYRQIIDEANTPEAMSSQARIDYYAQWKGDAEGRSTVTTSLGVGLSLVGLATFGFGEYLSRRPDSVDEITDAVESSE
jgi:hypothetical protein